MRVQLVVTFAAGAASALAVLALAGVPRRDTTRNADAPRAAPVLMSPATGFVSPPKPAQRFTYAPIDPARELIEPIPESIEEFFEDYLERDYHPELIELGRRLFHDPRLSTDNSISCATCHDLRYGGADRAVTPTGHLGQIGSMNTPTVFNAVFHLGQFWDGRAPDLEAQVDGPPNTPTEMASNWEEISAKLNTDGSLMADFERAFPEGEFDESVDARFVRLAIAEFERTLITPNAPFDRYLRGDTGAVSEAAKEGYQLFKDVGCIECHNGMGVGGGSFQVVGRRKPYFDPGMSDVHLGRFNVTGLAADKHVFKVGSLRNIELTAPYLHDGSLDKLEDVVRMMADHQIGRSISDSEVTRIVEFLRSLTGEYGGRPLKSLQNTITFRAAGD